MTVKQMINVIRRNRSNEIIHLIQKMNEEIEIEVPSMKEEIVKLLQRSVKEGDVSYIPSLSKRLISVGHATENEKEMILKHALKACRRLSSKNIKVYAKYERVKSYWMDVVVEVDTRPLLLKVLDCITSAIGLGQEEE